MNKTELILATAPAHHRLVWIHPFMDGNGRVARLISHAMLLETLDTGAVWSAARGLARNVEAYKRHLASCDEVRRNELDGRGHLSEEALAAFTEFFLTVCIDQVNFMESLMQPDRLRTRILMWGRRKKSGLTTCRQSQVTFWKPFFIGVSCPAAMWRALFSGERHARRIVSALVERGVLVSQSSRAPLRLVFPTH